MQCHRFSLICFVSDIQILLMLIILHFIHFLNKQKNEQRIFSSFVDKVLFYYYTFVFLTQRNKNDRSNLHVFCFMCGEMFNTGKLHDKKQVIKEFLSQFSFVFLCFSVQSIFVSSRTIVFHFQWSLNFLLLFCFHNFIKISFCIIYLLNVSR